MLRAIGTIGLGVVFIATSAALRMSLMADVETIEKQIETHSPFSYIGLGLLVLIGLMLGMHRSSQLRS